MKLSSPRLQLTPAMALLLASFLAIPAFADTPPAASSETPPVSAAAPAPAPMKAIRPENKWRIECSEGAKSDGNIVFLVTPEGGAPIEVTAAIENGTSENAVARRIRDAFRAALPKDSFTVETDDGEDVLVKKRLGKPAFALQLVKNEVAGVRLDIERE